MTRYGLAKMHRLNAILSSSPSPQSTNLLKHIQYFVKHNVRYLIFPQSPLWAIDSKAFKFYSKDTEIQVTSLCS